MLDKIIYEDIGKDKPKYLKILSSIVNIYKEREIHIKVIECEQWYSMLMREPIKTEFTPDALIALKNIMNDSANYFLMLGDFQIGKDSMLLMNKISELFNQNKNENLTEN